MEAIVFDVDGTLVDSVDLHARAWQEALSRFGYAVQFEAVRSQIGKGGDQLIPVFVPGSELDRVYEALDAARAALWKSDYLHKVRGFPRVRELVQRLLSDGKRLVLASSAKRDELAEYERVAGIDDLIDAATSSDDAAHSKPYPDIFLAALERLGNPQPARCVVIGDSPHDAAAAKAAGLRVVGLLCGGFEEAALRRAGCIAIYRDPAHLLEVYERAGDRALETDYPSNASR